MAPSAEQYRAKEGDTLIEKPKVRDRWWGAYAVEGRHFEVVGFGETERKKKGRRGLLRRKEKEKVRTVIVKARYPEGLGRKQFAFWVDDDAFADIVSRGT